LAAGFYPKKLVFARKNNCFARDWGTAAPQPLGRTPMSAPVITLCSKQQHLRKNR